MGYHHQEGGLTKQQSHDQELNNRFVFWKQRTCHIWEVGFDGCIQELAILYLTLVAQFVSFCMEPLDQVF